jgi:hypothetical protein
MEKKEITLLPKKNIVFDFGNMSDIEVIPYLTVDTKRQIAEAYLSSFFENNSFDQISLNEITAENALILSIVDLCTNLSIDFKETPEKFDYLMGSGLWEELQTKISGYSEFRKILDNMVKHIREDIAIEKSIGNTFDKLADYLMDVIKKFAEADISTDAIVNALKPIENQVAQIQNVANEIPIQPKQPRKKRTTKEAK